MNRWLRIGTRVSVIGPLSVVVHHMQMTGLQMAGFQLACDRNNYKIMIKPEEEGVEWARGWDTKAARALEVKSALA